MEGIKHKLLSISPTFQSVFYYKVWERRGKICGIHKDFGKLAFTRSDILSSNYHCDQEEAVEILLEFVGILEYFDNL